MCGIVGIIGKSSLSKIDISELYRMLDIQKHRGPDDQGVVGIDLSQCCGCHLQNQKIFEGGGAVGFNRLSIQDLSLKGHQPMMDAERKVILVFNGEIYNFKELRSELIHIGCHFDSGTDTEVILKYYLEYGIEETLLRLNGMFAFAIIDLRLRKTFIARDRFGIKPLYYTCTQNYILFSSEIKSFLEFSEFVPKLNTDALGEYMIFRNLIGITMLKGVYPVMPGECITINFSDISMQHKMFFSWEGHLGEKYTELSEKEWEEKFRYTLEDSVIRQTISDVKVGCQLSGGVDSSLVTYVAMEKCGLRDTISEIVPMVKFSEEGYIDHVNEKLGTIPHKEQLDASFFINHIVDTVWHYEAMLPHTNMTGIYQLAKNAKKYVTVLLSGEGADELFGGYDWFLNAMCADSEADYEKTVITGDGYVEKNLCQMYYPQIPFDRLEEKRYDSLMSFTGTRFERHRKYQLLSYLPECLIRQDKMTMAHSIENRVPILDNSMGDLAFSVPERFLLNTKDREGKMLLKKLCAKWYGERFAYRKKMGFPVPTNLYLLSDISFAHNIMCSARKRGIIDTTRMIEASRNIGKLHGAETDLFFKVFTFEIWCQLYLDGKNKKEVGKR